MVIFWQPQFSIEQSSIVVKLVKRLYSGEAALSESASMLNSKAIKHIITNCKEPLQQPQGKLCVFTRCHKLLYGLICGAI